MGSVRDWACVRLARGAGRVGMGGGGGGGWLTKGGIRPALAGAPAPVSSPCQLCVPRSVSVSVARHRAVPLHTLPIHWNLAQGAQGEGRHRVSGHGHCLTGCAADGWKLALAELEWLLERDKNIAVSL